MERLLESDPVIKQGLQRGIINTRALARYILKTTGVDTTLEGLLGTIRRFPLETDQEHSPQRSSGDCEISMRNRMADLVIESSPDVFGTLAEFARTNKVTKRENLRIIVGLESVRLIADQKALNTFREAFRPKSIISFSTDLAEISILFPMDAKIMRGITANITAQLALNEISPVGILVWPPEEFIIVAERDAPRAFETIQDLLRADAQEPKDVAASRNGFHKQGDYLSAERINGSALKIK